MSGEGIFKRLQTTIRKLYTKLDTTIDKFNTVVSEFDPATTDALKCRPKLERVDVKGEKLDSAFDYLLSDPVDGDEDDMVEKGIMTTSARRTTRLLLRMRAVHSVPVVMLRDLRLLQTARQNELALLQEIVQLLKAYRRQLAHADASHSNMQALHRAVGMCTQVREQIKQESLRLSVTERTIGLVEGAVQRFQEQYPHPLYCYHDVDHHPLASVDIDAVYVCMTELDVGDVGAGAGDVDAMHVNI
jgi:hypothetical protein